MCNEVLVIKCNKVVVKKGAGGADGDDGAARRAMPPKALRGGISKVNFEQSLSTFGNTCPQNGSKNEPMGPRTSL